MVHVNSVQQQKEKEKEKEDDTFYEWVLFHEMIQSERTRIVTYGTKLPSPWIIMFFVGKQAIIEEKQVKVQVELVDQITEEKEETKWFLVIDDWIVFEISTQKKAQQILQLRKYIQQVFRHHIQFHQELFHQEMLYSNVRRKSSNSTPNNDRERKKQKEIQGGVQHIIQWLASFSQTH
jgi:hypothetical protein